MWGWRMQGGKEERRGESRERRKTFLERHRELIEDADGFEGGEGMASVESIRSCAAD